MNKYNKCAISVAVAAVSMGASTTTLAQATLEEVVVTATKRAVGLQDVPIAISVVSGEAIEQYGLTELDELSAQIPNVHIGESGGNNQIFIRGIGSGNNSGFEQSVGTFIDGVYFGRARNSRAAFLDLERIEVLKGPQSTLFGKNTIAGAINITSAQPEDEFSAYVEGSYETELDGRALTAMVTGPISESVKGRLVAKTFERDGWMENQFPGATDGTSQDNEVIRATLVWDASDVSTFTLKAEYGEWGTVGANSTISHAEPGSVFLFGLNDPDFAATIPDAYRQSQTPGRPGREVKDDTESTILQLSWDYDLGESQLRSITSYTEYEFERCLDVDYTSIDLIDQCTDESNEQFTQEFLFSSPQGEVFEYLAGIYYQTATLDIDTDIGTQWSSVPPLESAVFAAIGNPALPVGAIDGLLRGVTEQKTRAWSAFAEVTWNITPEFRTIFGLRYSDDKKEIDKDNTVSSLTGSSPLSNAQLNGIYTAFSFFTTYSYELERSEDHVTGNLNFQWDVSDDTMAYVNFATGFKAGGFDTSNNMDRSREFEDEGVKSIDLGMKSTLWDGRARVNAAYFVSEYSDVQVSSFESASFIVGNAAKSEVQGVEVDFTVAATETIEVNGAIAWLDAEYKNYKNGPCLVADLLSGDCSNTNPQDLSGTTLQFSPEISGQLGIQYRRNLTESLGLIASVQGIYSDDFHVAPNGDRRSVQKAHTKVNARLSLESNDGQWSLALVGKNLTDKTTFNWANDATLSGQRLGFDNAYFRQYEAPRTYELQARYYFD
ncbi:TonB-dependent receptor [Pseudoteredinibacter isoporae]|uniref:Outer membrane receptor protein involved in Fe transport n=1 Tax=Pseudoteredinibacter isoporae TaxID=570281 RepID=A0A7X0JUH6_9GAMM|nr:TonB-dependent receptor [Pseudoteredinibacter isoporae]MBB6522508.1 outer membrane receptor protein involved in Fe transport [Pseudoteredinibacter isoporae]NHO88037.1 TonB-dependent receptor [Pseudoteredinibacter isoporae]NIB23632.1 TonB-dependent receptor [Pseudoteredinibacter isoporae]